MGPTTPAKARSTAAPEFLEGLGGAILRYGLAGILFYIGAFKFTAVEAKAIEPLIANSPLTSWLYSVASLRVVSNLIGAVEMVTAALILTRPIWRRVSALGSLAATGTFAVTISFLFTTPGVWVSVPGFPIPVPSEGGGFLLKDVFLLGAAIWTAGEALRSPQF